ncbi:kinase-like protein [Hyaloscypha variabilis F]|uniref:Kinase-like protein n=1 Tax=Hyaloscypha variabilis (strain UAMH 11265 / GT02V1 / F) TaxID=1149755 RepID=A0A2J6QYW4_HYAVF|nr:kinase-like protein [Hyaloscypha variabilis F]
MSYLSHFEHTKLDAHNFPGFVVQTHYISDPITGQRRVPKTKVWRVERVLGKGSFGEVRLEVCLEENERRAVRRIWATGSAFKTQYERELKALLEFSKPKYKEWAVFVEFFGWFEDLDSVYLAMEYIPLGDLEENALACGGTIKEAEAKEIAVQILEGLKIMHLENFTHRDLKPKNILVCQGPPHWWVKLAGFGLSKRRAEGTAYRTQTGTLAYMAPEILGYVPGINPGTTEYTNAVDIWALGCIVYRLSSGVVPFPLGPSLAMFCGDESKFPSEALALSELGSIFIRDLLVPYPSHRLSAQSALDHAWIRAGNVSFYPSDKRKFAEQPCS